MLLFYIRHGDPIYDPDSLTPLGRRQAEALAKRLARYGLDEIYASSSKRAIETAQPTSELVKKEIKVLDWCNEGHAWQEFAVPLPEGGEIWGYQNADCREKFLLPEVTALGEKWHEHKAFEGANFGNGVRRIARETDALFETLGYRHDREYKSFRAVAPNEKRIALFAHEGFGMAFLSSLLDIPYPLFCTRVQLCHSGMTVIRFNGKDRVTPELLQFSGDSHVYAEGLPTKYNGEIYF
jgi:probable phosphoglycerate mutase